MNAPIATEAQCAGSLQRVVSHHGQTHLDLFSGIGGFALAAASAGFKTIGFSEIEPTACKVLKHHWPKIPNYGDVRTVPTIKCDLITGGFPCQPFSVAGERRGASDDRFLWPAMLDVIARCEPAYVLGENVPGLIGMELDRVLADLESLGFWTQPLVIPACAVGGMHKRDRVWICAHTKRPRLQGREQNNGVSGGTRASRAEPRNRVSASWDELERHCRSLRKSDGLSCQMVRNQIHAYGNAIVPQVASELLKALVMANTVLGDSGAKPHPTNGLDSKA